LHTKYDGIVESSANGSSKLETMASIKPSTRGATSNSRWFVRYRAATIRAYVRSSSKNPVSPANPIVNVLTGLSEACAMNATTALESIPPLRNAPSGTSLIRRTPTALRIRCVNSSMKSCSDRVRSVLNDRSQYWRCRLLPPSTVIV
jgi:hypothetical protein